MTDTDDGTLVSSAIINGQRLKRISSFYLVGNWAMFYKYIMGPKVHQRAFKVWHAIGEIVEDSECNCPLVKHPSHNSYHSWVSLINVLPSLVDGTEIRSNLGIENPCDLSLSLLPHTFSDPSS